MPNQVKSTDSVFGIAICTDYTSTNVIMDALECSACTNLAGFVFCYEVKTTPSVNFDAIQQLVLSGLFLIEAIESSSTASLRSGYKLISATETTPYPTLRLQIIESTSSHDLNIRISLSSPVTIESSGQNYRFINWNRMLTVKLEISPKEIAQVKVLGNGVAMMVGINPTGNSNVGEAINILVNLDPTGTLSRMGQSMKTFSRLSYANFNYGIKLGIFFDELEKSSGVDKVSKGREMTHSRVGTRAKLTRYKVGVEVMNTIYTWRCLFYIFSSALSQLVTYFRIGRQSQNIPLLYLLFVYPFIHTFVFNMCISDLTFTSTRIFLHSNIVSHIIFAQFILILISIDFYTLLKIGYDGTLWNRLYKETEYSLSSYALNSGVNKKNRVKYPIKQSLLLSSSSNNISSNKMVVRNKNSLAKLSVSTLSRDNIPQTRNVPVSSIAPLRNPAKLVPRGKRALTIKRSSINIMPPSAIRNGSSSNIIETKKGYSSKTNIVGSETSLKPVSLESILDPQ